MLPEEFMDFLRLCEKKMADGEKKYGVFNPLVDTRIFGFEGIKEVADASNYMDLGVERFRQDHMLRMFAFAVKSRLIEIYPILRRFEEREKELLSLRDKSSKS